MLIPVISLMLPILIQSAEHMFLGEKKGPEKRAFVLQALSSTLDKTTLPKYIDKELVMELAAVLLEHYVPAVVK